MPPYRQKQTAQKQRRKGKKRKDGKPPTSEESPGNSWGDDQWQSKALNGKDEPPERKEPAPAEREERQDGKPVEDILGSSLRMDETLDRDEKENAKKIEDEKENDDPMIRVMVPFVIIMSILVIAFGIYLKITEKEQNQKNQQTEQKITKDGGANSERNGRKSFSYPGIK